MYERGAWDNIGNCGTSRERITQAYLEALSWATHLDKELKAPP
jgi:hypothetical protein